MAKSSMQSKTYGGVASFIKGIVVSFIITFSAIIIFAFTIKWTDISDSLISPINLIIKGVSIAVGALLFTRKSKNGIIKGAIFGVFYTVIAFALFSLLAGTFNLGFGLLLDIAFAVMIGAIMGIIGVNTRK